ncbi:MAG: hypothetical protein AMXMBFR64_39700 [Myxococcales bacterium]
MSRRRDRRRRQDRRARNQQAAADLPARRNDNVIRLRRRVVFLDRGGLIVEFTFASWMEAGVLDEPVVPAENVLVTHRHPEPPS